MELLTNALQFLARIPMWAMLAVPLLIPLYLLRKFMLYRNYRTTAACIAFSAVTSLLLAPLPMGMFMVFIPNGYLLFSGPEYYVLVWKWVAWSLPITALIAFPLAKAIIMSPPQFNQHGDT